jgi:two-component system, OmpR family, response regulator TctD
MSIAERLVMRHLILVLDNEFETTGMLREALRPIGFEVAWINVAAVLSNEWLKQSKFQGIILNYDMRGYPGTTILKRLHEQGVEIPVIVMSVPSNREQLEYAVRSGARDYIVKPIDIVELQQKCLRYFATPHTEAPNLQDS